MAAKKGPIDGTRVPVQLPYAAKNVGVVGIKKPVAEFFGFDISKLPTYKTKNPSAKSGRKETIRYKRGGYRGKSIKLVFSKEQKIGTKTVKQVSIPLPKGVHTYDAYEYFNQKASKFNLEKFVSPDGKTTGFTNV